MLVLQQHFLAKVKLPLTYRQCLLVCSQSQAIRSGTANPKPRGLQVYLLIRNHLLHQPTNLTLNHLLPLIYGLCRSKVAPISLLYLLKARNRQVQNGSILCSTSMHRRCLRKYPQKELTQRLQSLLLLLLRRRTDIRMLE